MTPIFPDERLGNADRERIAAIEPIATRTYTPTQAVIDRSAGVYFWTTDGRRLLDFTSGVLVANLGHNPTSWTERFLESLGWNHRSSGSDFISAVPLTAYNAITPVERDATERLLSYCRNQPGGSRLHQVQWAVSGSEAVHKAIYTAMHADPNRPMVLATRNGFHGKKGLAYAVTGNERDPERDARVRFIAFPTEESRDVSLRDRPFDPTRYSQELDHIWSETDGRIGTLVTEPYLGGGGSYHPPKEYLQLLQSFCRKREIVFILDEVQSNFGRTGMPFAYSTYGLEPDLVVLGKGLGNGVPVAAVVGRSDLFGKLTYGDLSDTWSANPLSSAAVVATLDEFESRDILGPMRAVSHRIEADLVSLKKFPFVAHVRGERDGMVWGVECQPWNGKSAREWAIEFVKACYRGDGRDGVHFLGPLAGTVVRIAPPLIINSDEAALAMGIVRKALSRLVSVSSHHELC